MRKCGALEFSGTLPGAMVGNSVMTNALRTAGIVASGHGFRSSFKDWARLHDVDELLSEFALAHVEGSATVAAYARDDLLEKRRPVMQQWGATRESSRFFASALMKPLEQLSRPARSAGRETGYAANHSLRAVRRWQRRRAKRPDNVPPRRRLGDREVADGFCQLRADEGQG